MWNYFKKKYLRTERTVWELKEPALLSEHERKNRVPEKSQNFHHFFRYHFKPFISLKITF